MPPVTVGNCDLYHGDCLELLPTLDFTADLVIADPPYGITRCDWDTAPDLPRMEMDAHWFNAACARIANYRGWK